MLRLSSDRDITNVETINFSIPAGHRRLHQYQYPIVAPNLTLLGTTGDDVLVGGLGNDTIDPVSNAGSFTGWM